MLVRNPGKIALDLRTPRLESVPGDLNDAAALRSAMAGIDHVYHLARADAKSWSDYERYDIGVTREVAEAALAAGVKRLIYTGTIDSYYAGARAGTITEDTPLDPRIERRNLYARAKAASERHLLKMHRERGLPVVIVRPGIVIGRGGSPMHWGIGMWWHGSVCQIWGAAKPVAARFGRRRCQRTDRRVGSAGNRGRIVQPCRRSQSQRTGLSGRSGSLCGVRIQRYATPIVKFYLTDMFKWGVKVLVRHPDRRLPSYRDWESRQQRATFDCGRAKVRLGWKPASDRAELIRSGIHEPMKEMLS